MSNFGFLRLRVVNPYEVAYAEAKSAVNAATVLESSEQYATVAEAIADCTLVVGTTAVGHRQLQHSLHRLEYGAGLIRQELDIGRVALLFGTEKFGLSNEDMARCQLANAHSDSRRTRVDEPGTSCCRLPLRTCTKQSGRDGGSLKPSAAQRQKMSTVLPTFSWILCSGQATSRTLPANPENRKPAAWSGDCGSRAATRLPC